MSVPWINITTFTMGRLIQHNPPWQNLTTPLFLTLNRVNAHVNITGVKYVANPVRVCHSVVTPVNNNIRHFLLINQEAHDTVETAETQYYSQYHMHFAVNDATLLIHEITLVFKISKIKYRKYLYCIEKSMYGIYYI